MKGQDMAVTSAKRVAEWFIWRANTDEDFGDNITNLKLQKLVYYAQGFHLAWFEEPLFDEEIEAWQHGPVVRNLYFDYRNFQASGIPTPEEFDPDNYSEQTHELLEEVYSVYGQYSAWGLRNLTHEEAPWKDTPRDGVIPQEAMATFFRDHLTNA